MDITRLTLLIVDDDEDDVELLRRRLQAVDGWQVDILAFTDPAAARAALASRSVDVVVIDYLLGRETGLALLKDLRTGGCDIPVIMATGQGSEELAVEVMKAGADDYLIKGDLSSEAVRRAISNALDKHRLRRALEARRRELIDAHNRLKRNHEENQRFYHIVSHELKTPLTSARDFIAIVLDDLAGPITARQREYLLIAKDSCDQLTRGINDLLDGARLETGKLSIAPVRTSVERLVSKAVTPLKSRAENRGIHLSVELAPALPEVHVDENRMVQVINNLLNNALKFTPPGGRIAVTAEAPAAANSDVWITVRDSGRGIESEQLPYVFDRLYQVRADDTAAGGGLGLGLYICCELVRLHGGEIAVESAPGSGSTFRFTMPVYAAQTGGRNNLQEHAA